LDPDVFLVIVEQNVAGVDSGIPSTVGNHQNTPNGVWIVNRVHKLDGLLHGRARVRLTLWLESGQYSIIIATF
jgi:hypothetical protein